MLPPGAAGGALKRFVERGGGLLVVARRAHDVAARAKPTLLPGKLGATVDRLDGRGGTLGYLDYSHPVFEVFKAPRSGDFSAARVFRYRALDARPGDRVLARFDDGAVAAAEQRVGTGRVIAWTTTLDDSWNDLALKPVYLPLVHQLDAIPGALRRTGGVADGRPGVDLSAGRSRPEAAPIASCDAVGRAGDAVDRAAAPGCSS